MKQFAWILTFLLIPLAIAYAASESLQTNVPAEENLKLSRISAYGTEGFELRMKAGKSTLIKFRNGEEIASHGVSVEVARQTDEKIGELESSQVGSSDLEGCSSVVEVTRGIAGEITREITREVKRTTFCALSNPEAARIYSDLIFSFAVDTVEDD